MKNRITPKFDPNDYPLLAQPQIAASTPTPAVGSETKFPFQHFYDGYLAGRKYERLQMEKQGVCSISDSQEQYRWFDRGVKWERQRTHADSVFARVEERGDGQSDSVLNAFVWMGIGMVLVCLLT